MSFAARFPLPSITEDDDMDLSKCDTCEHAHGDCFNAGKCLREDY